MSEFDALYFAPVLITDLFILHNGAGSPKKESGPVPYIAASFQNNGVVGYVEKPMYPGGWLSFVKDGDGGAGTCFYQPIPFWPSNHVFALEPRSDKATEEALLMLAATITHQCFPKYNRGFAANARRLSRQKIMVPVIDVDGAQTVDWTGMTRMGRELCTTVTERMSQVITTDPGQDQSLPELAFEPRLITEVFGQSRQAPSWLNTNQVIGGMPEFPHVTNSAGSNSVAGFIARQHKAPNPGNAITIGIDTQVVAYQPVPYYGATKVFELRAPELNKDNALVLVASLRSAIEKFSWGYKASATRLKRTRLMVPTICAANGRTVIDWDGMREYGQVLRARVERELHWGRQLSRMNSCVGEIHGTRYLF